jgi:uncharacterized protein YcbK (DUF882 family)
MGSGTLHLRNHRNGQEARISLIADDGSLNEAGLTAADRIVGFPTADKGEHFSPRLLFMLSHFADQAAPGRTIHIESGYRSPDYNSAIRDRGANAARTSTHMDGMALDFWIEGVDGKALWETIRAKNCCGVGHYGGKILHLDAGRPRFWEAATSGTGRKEPDYNRFLYLSTDYDRYRRSESVRLSLSGISTFDFGVRPTVDLVHPDAPEQSVTTVRLSSGDRGDCLRIKERKQSRFLHTTLPPSLPPGLYAARLSFCDKPFSQMPDAVLSNPFEIGR